MFSFHISPEYQSQALFDLAFYASWGRIPKWTKTEVRDSLLFVYPEIAGTGTVHIPMSHPLYGIQVRSTETLKQRDKPYLLLKELGRGEFGRLVRLLEEWKMLGFTPSDAQSREIRELFHSFGVMATSDETLPETERMASVVFELFGSLEIRLINQYFEYIIATLDEKRLRLNTELGIFLGSHGMEDLFEMPSDSLIRSLFDETFQFVAAMPSWKSVEHFPGKFHWEPVDRYFQLVETLGKRPFVGPILSFDPASFPQWVHERIDDREVFEDAATRYTIEFAKRYGQHGSHWIVAADMFSSPLCGFSVGRGVSLICDLTREVKYAARDKDVLVSIDQPYGDYYRTNSCPLPFIAIVESLASVRSLDGFLLDIKLGTTPQDTLPRDPMLMGRLIDQWSLWGKKFFISFSVPNQWNVFQENCPKNCQLEWGRRAILTCLTRRNVYGIFWNPLRDTPEERSTGLIGTGGQVKPIFHSLAEIQRTLLEQE